LSRVVYQAGNFLENLINGTRAEDKVGVHGDDLESKAHPLHRQFPPFEEKNGTGPGGKKHRSVGDPTLINEFGSNGLRGEHDAAVKQAGKQNGGQK
jgi:hypothetical protein